MFFADDSYVCSSCLAKKYSKMVHRKLFVMSIVCNGAKKVLILIIEN